VNQAPWDIAVDLRPLELCGPQESCSAQSWNTDYEQLNQTNASLELAAYAVFSVCALLRVTNVLRTKI